MTKTEIEELREHASQIDKILNDWENERKECEQAEYKGLNTIQRFRKRITRKPTLEEAIKDNCIGL